MWPTSTKTPERAGDIQGCWTLQYLPGSAVTVSIPPAAWIVCPGSAVLIVSHHFLSVSRKECMYREMSAHCLPRYPPVARYLC